MSREIKFRVWDRSLKKMLYTGGLTVSNNEVTDLIGIPLQYTGLKDRNGKEIYEGDRLKTIWIKWVIGDTLKEEVKYITVESIFEFNVLDAITKADQIEVIGNIYENPELLQ